MAPTPSADVCRWLLDDDPSIRWQVLAAGTYRTPHGVTSAVMERLGLEWDDWIAHDDTYVVDGDNVVVLAHYTATNKATGKHIDVRVAHHFFVRGGRIVRFEQFVDTAKVREAMRADTTNRVYVREGRSVIGPPGSPHRRRLLEPPRV